MLDIDVFFLLLLLLFLKEFNQKQTSEECYKSQIQKNVNNLKSFLLRDLRRVVLDLSRRVSYKDKSRKRKPMNAKLFILFFFFNIFFAALTIKMFLKATLYACFMPYLIQLFSKNFYGISDFSLKSFEKILI